MNLLGFGKDIFYFMMLHKYKYKHILHIYIKMQTIEDSVEDKMINLMSKIDEYFHNLHHHIYWEKNDEYKQLCNEILINTNKLLNKYTDILTNDEKCAIKFKQHWIFGFMSGQNLAIEEDIMCDNYVTRDGYHDLVIEHDIISDCDCQKK